MYLSYKIHIWKQVWSNWNCDFVWYYISTILHCSAKNFFKDLYYDGNLCSPYFFQNLLHDFFVYFQVERFIFRHNFPSSSTHGWLLDFKCNFFLYHWYWCVNTWLYLQKIFVYTLLKNWCQNIFHLFSCLSKTTCFFERFIKTSNSLQYWVLSDFGK